MQRQQPLSEGLAQEGIDIQDMLVYYKSLLSDKEEQLAVMFGRLKNRDREIETLRGKLDRQE